MLRLSLASNQIKKNQPINEMFLKLKQVALEKRNSGFYKTSGGYLYSYTYIYLYMQ
jgi:hypothetical protein